MGANVKLQRAGELTSSVTATEPGLRAGPRGQVRGYGSHAASSNVPARETQAPSLDVVGRMASELSHELNNQLAAALNYTAIVERRVGADHPLAEHLSELRASLWRATSAAAALRLVGRRGSDQPEMIALDEALDAMAPVLRHLTPSCTLEVMPVTDAAPVRARRADLERLIVMITHYAYSRRVGAQGLCLRVESLPPDHSRPGSFMRVVCEVDQEHSMDGEPPVRGRLVARAGLRRALKRCGARVGHDMLRAWVDLPLAAS
jgi:signal transduction histidine kinase